MGIILLSGSDFYTREDLVKSALGDRLQCAGGFYTRRRITPAGNEFDLCPAAEAAGIDCGGGSAYLRTGNAPFHDTEVFREKGVGLLNEAVLYPFAVLLETGGFELIIPQFREALGGLLNSGLPLIISFKTAEESEAIRCALGLGERFTAYRDAVFSAVSGSPRTICADADTVCAEDLKALSARAGII